MQGILKNKWFWIGVIVFILIIAIYYTGKAAGRRPQVKLPNSGSGIPTGWDPGPAAINLHEALSGWGTDEDRIFDTLSQLTPDQCAAVYNEYNTRYNANLLDDFEEELSGNDLTNALSYFNGINF